MVNGQGQGRHGACGKFAVADDGFGVGSSDGEDGCLRGVMTAVK